MSKSIKIQLPEEYAPWFKTTVMIVPHKEGIQILTVKEYKRIFTALHSGLSPDLLAFSHTMQNCHIQKNINEKGEFYIPELYDARIHPIDSCTFSSQDPKNILIPVKR